MAIQIQGTTVIDDSRNLTNITTIGVDLGGTGISTTPSNGSLLIGNGTGYTLTTLTAGVGTTIVNGTGSITISGNAFSAF